MSCNTDLGSWRVVASIVMRLSFLCCTDIKFDVAVCDGPRRRAGQSCPQMPAE
jgi:hypothetical protein